MPRSNLLWLIVASFATLGMLSACNLQAGSEIEIAITEAPTAIIVTETPSPTAIIATEEPTVIPVSSPLSTGEDNQDNTCVQTNLHWQNHIVQAGDTLASIAIASNSTLDTLASVNCIANANQISVGQAIRVPQFGTPAIPLIDTGPVPANVCGVEPLIPPIDIFGDGGASFARLQGTILVIGRIDLGYFVDVPGFTIDGYVLANEVRELGSNCPEIPLPVINQAPPFVASCMVVANNGRADIYRPGPADPVASLMQAQYVRTADNAYIINTPSLGGESWVSATETSLSGDDCAEDVPVVHICLETYNSENPVVISPSKIVEDDCVSISSGVITVSYPDAPADFAMVEFWMQHASGNTDVIGTDTTPADGASIQYQVYDSHPDSLVYAFAYGTEANSSTESGQVAVYFSD